MMRKTPKLLATLLLGILSLFAFSACIENGHLHLYTMKTIVPTCTEGGYTLFTCDCGDSYTMFEKEALGHTFDQKVVEDEYLRTPTTCTHSAVYFYSCACGEMGTETFTYQEPLGHAWSEGVITTKPTCTQPGVITFTCGNCQDKREETMASLGHTFDQKVATVKYLNTPPEGENLATYFYSCACGEKGTEIFYYGTHNEHTYNLKIKTEQYLKSAVNCETPATYYYACACGKKGSATYTDGTALGHTPVVDEAVPATCVKNGLTEGSHCETCNKVLQAQETITAVGQHHFTDKICDNCHENLEDLAYDFYDISANTDKSLMAYLVQNNSYFDVYIVGSGACKDYTGNNTPFSTDGYAGKIKTVTISEGITTIGNYLFFECGNLTTINIPKGVMSIGSGALGHCYDLATISIPESVTSIGNSAFYMGWYNASLTSVTFGENCNLKTIGADAFNGCVNLTSIKIPNSVTSIGNSAFYGCSDLSTISIGNNLTYLGNGAFANTAYESNLNNWKNRVLYIGNYIISAKASLTEITIGKEIRGIADYAFSSCASLTSVAFEEESKCSFIGSDAFYNCSGLKSIVIPSNVTTIGDSAFSNCSNLTSVVIPASVTSIGDQAFYNCSNLTSVVIPDSVTSIGNGAFSNCSNLTSVVIPDSVTSIGNGEFSDCSKLTSISFNGTKEEWKKIVKGAFWDSGIDNYTIHCTDGDI